MVDGLLYIPLNGRSLSHRSAATQPETDLYLRDFVVGPENRLVATAVEAILQQTSFHYNPIVFCGPPGSGKTHLAWGLAAVWKARFPRRSVIYTPAIDFAQELSDASDSQSIEDFRQAFRGVSLLVIEDLGQLAGRLFAQQELAETIDALVGSCNRVVLTSQSSPVELSGISARLQSRLAAGLVVPLALPSPETRLAVVLRLADLRGLDLPEAAARALADGVCGTVSELAGALLQLEARAAAERRKVDLDCVLSFLAERRRCGEPSLRAIAALTARYFSLKVADLQSASRSRAVVTARCVAMYLARTLTRCSLGRIGCYFGGRDHTTVSYGCRRTERLLQAEPAMRRAIAGLRDRLLQIG